MIRLKSKIFSTLLTHKTLNQPVIKDRFWGKKKERNCRITRSLFYHFLSKYHSITIKSVLLQESKSTQQYWFTKCTLAPSMYKATRNVWQGVLGNKNKPDLALLYSFQKMNSADTGQRGLKMHSKGSRQCWWIRKHSQLWRFLGKQGTWRKGRLEHPDIGE